jgi:hypothetical protein
VEILVTSDALEEKNITVEYKVLTFDGKVIKSGKKEQIIAANSVAKVMEVEISDIKDMLVPEETILYASVKEGEQVLNENRYFFAPYGKLALKPATVSCEIKKLSDISFELTLSADTFVWMLHLATPDGVDFSDNDFDLLPGRAVKIVVSKDTDVSYEPEFYSLNPRMNVKVMK